MKLILAIIVLLVSSHISMADTTIYKCKDNNGRLIFQQTACDDKNIMGDTDVHKLWGEMRVLTAEGKGILGMLSADLESIKQCHRDIAVFKKNILALKSRVAVIEKSHKDILQAYDYLMRCAECRTSAESNCNAAEKSLEKAVSNLTEW